MQTKVQTLDKGITPEEEFLLIDGLAGADV